MKMSEKLILPCDVSKVSDGYHTFEELYAHRCVLMVTLMLCNPDNAWWSELHEDGSKYEGWLIVGLNLDAGTITYHIPAKWVGHLSRILHLERAPKWDGHTSADVLERLETFADAMAGLASPAQSVVSIP